MFLNAGETTRAIEIAKALRKLFKTNPESSCEIAFFSTMFADDDQVSYQTLVRKAGFDATCIGKGYTNEEWKAIEHREHNGQAFYDPKDQARVARSMLEMQEMMLYYGPDLIVHGFMHDLSGPIAAKVLNIPTISFCPIPMDVEWTKRHLMTDFPEEKRSEKPLSQLELLERRALLQQMAFDPSIPSFNTVPTCVKAALDAGWNPPTHTQQPGKLLLQDMMDANLNLVNDLEGNYTNLDIPARSVVTGPVFPRETSSSSDSIDDPRLAAFMNENTAPSTKKVLITMGSSGHAEHIVSALEAVQKHQEQSNNKYKVIAIVPPSTASLDDIRQSVMSTSGESMWPSNIYLTNTFVSSMSRLHKWADVSLIHGGQGTVQSAMASGTPVIGVDLQMEQHFNLSNVERRGAGIHLSPRQWSPPESLERALDTVLRENREYYVANAQQVQSEMSRVDGAVVSAQIIHDYLHHQEWMRHCMDRESVGTTRSVRASARG